MDKSNLKNVKKTINRSILAPKVQSNCSKQNWASKNDKTQSKKVYKQVRSLAIEYSARIRYSRRLDIGRV
jgi:hypothetical protein